MKLKSLVSASVSAMAKGAAGRSEITRLVAHQHRAIALAVDSKGFSDKSIINRSPIDSSFLGVNACKLYSKHLMKHPELQFCQLVEKSYKDGEQFGDHVYLVAKDGSIIDSTWKQFMAMEIERSTLVTPQELKRICAMNPFCDYESYVLKEPAGNNQHGFVIDNDELSEEQGAIRPIDENYSFVSSGLSEQAEQLLRIRKTLAPAFVGDAGAIVQILAEYTKEATSLGVPLLKKPISLASIFSD